MSTKNSISSQILQCTSSEAEYAKHSESIFLELSVDSKRYLKDFLSTIYDILYGNHYGPSQRYYALLLLVKASEKSNRRLMAHLAGSKEFLNNLFHDAQFDLPKPVEEKGKTFFSDSPSYEERTLGNKYLRLLLGAITYWNKEYGSPDPDDPMHCFHAIYNSLAERTSLPGLSKSMTKSQLKDSKKRQSLSPQKDSFNQSMQMDHEIKENEAYLDLMKCVPSEESYHQNSFLVFRGVKKQGTYYTQMLLEAISEVLSEPFYTSTNKFYALYLLAKLSEGGDEVFINMVARDSRLLKTVHKHAKEAKNASRIRTDDQEGVHKKKLYVLALELVKYWDVVYGNSDLESPLHYFHYLYSDISKEVAFPKDYVYMTPPKVSEKQDNRPDSSYLQRQIEDEDEDPIARLIKAYVASGTVFREDYPNISVILIKQSPARSQSYLRETLRILNSSIASPKSKFYTLYLLTKTSEAKNKKLIIALAESRELLEKLLRDARTSMKQTPERRGRTFFYQAPTDEQAILGRNYMQLLLETLKFWAEAYGNKDRDDPNYVFKAMYDEIKRDIKLTEQNFYVGRNLEEIDEAIMQKFEIISYEDLPDEINKNKKEEKQPSISEDISLTDREDEVMFVDLEKQLELLNYSKMLLVQFLGTNKQNSDEEVIEKLVQDVLSRYNVGVYPFLKYLIRNIHPEAGRYKTMIKEEGKITDRLEQENLDYQVGKSAYWEFRQRVLYLLTDVHSSNPANKDLMMTISQSFSKKNKRGNLDTLPLSPIKAYGSDEETDQDPDEYFPRNRRNQPGKNSLVNRSIPARTSQYRSPGLNNMKNSRDPRSQSAGPMTSSIMLTKSNMKGNEMSSSRKGSPPREVLDKSSKLYSPEEEVDYKDLHGKLHEIKEGNVDMDRQNRFLVNSKFQLLQDFINKMDAENAEIEKLVNMVNETKNRVEEMENKVNEVKYKKTEKYVPAKEVFSQLEIQEKERLSTTPRKQSVASIYNNEKPVSRKLSFSDNEATVNNKPKSQVVEDKKEASRKSIRVIENKDNKDAQTNNNKTQLPNRRQSEFPDKRVLTPPKEIIVPPLESGSRDGIRRSLFVDPTKNHNYFDETPTFNAPKIPFKELKPHLPPREFKPISPSREFRPVSPLREFTGRSPEREFRSRSPTREFRARSPVREFREYEPRFPTRDYKLRSPPRELRSRSTSPELNPERALNRNMPSRPLGLRKDKKSSDANHPIASSFLESVEAYRNRKGLDV